MVVFVIKKSLYSDTPPGVSRRSHPSSPDSLATVFIPRCYGSFSVRLSVESIELAANYMTTAAKWAIISITIALVDPGSNKGLHALATCMGTL